MQVEVHLKMFLDVLDNSTTAVNQTKKVNDKIASLAIVREKGSRIIATIRDHSCSSESTIFSANQQDIKIARGAMYSFIFNPPEDNNFAANSCSHDNCKVEDQL